MGFSGALIGNDITSVYGG